jgi:hypothetical protein
MRSKDTVGTYDDGGDDNGDDDDDGDNDGDNDGLTICYPLIF